MEIEKHEDGWPFLQPIICKQVTSCRVVMFYCCLQVDFNYDREA